MLYEWMDLEGAHLETDNSCVSATHFTQTAPLLPTSTMSLTNLSPPPSPPLTLSVQPSNDTSNTHSQRSTRTLLPLDTFASDKHSPHLDLNHGKNNSRDQRVVFPVKIPEVQHVEPIDIQNDSGLHDLHLLHKHSPRTKPRRSKRQCCPIETCLLVSRASSTI